MPEYLAPGVYVEETSFRPKTIEGVSTSTAGFVGPTRFGPTQDEPELLTSFADFERIYGGLDPLEFGGTDRTNFLAHGIRAFFQEGGRRCYVVRVFAGSPGTVEAARAEQVHQPDGSGYGLRVRARYPGRAGDMRVTFEAVLGQNALVEDPMTGKPALRGVTENDVVLLVSEDTQPDTGYYDVVSVEDKLRLRPIGGATSGDDDVDFTTLTVGTDLVRVIRVAISVETPVFRPQRPSEKYAPPLTLEDLTLNPVNSSSVAKQTAENPSSRRIALTVPIVVQLMDGSVPEEDDATGAEWAAAIFGEPQMGSVPEDVEIDDTRLRLDDGSDGAAPSGADYLGTEGLTEDAPKSGLFALEEIEDVSIVAAPGYSFDYTGNNQSVVRTIQAHLITHCEKMKYRIAVLDSPNNQVVSEVRDYRAQIDSKYAALYYPWVTVLDPITQEELNLPPSGFVAGIYARNDVDFGVQKAPANETVRLALRFETMLNKSQQDVLNPEGINCFRFFEGRGYLLWGARIPTSDGEWKYVNLRRYFAYLERSIDKGTQVFVFESNGERLWANVRRTISDFLLNEWKTGRLMGITPEEAFFVRCDRTTMTQNDIDNGRLICEIGVAPLRPAEFVIFRIGQKLLEMTA